MDFIFVISYVALWGVVILLAGIILNLIKRLTAVNAFMYNSLPKDLPLSHEGIEVGEHFYSLSAQDIAGREVSWTSSQTKGSIVIFTSSFCSTCKSVYPVLQDITQKNASYQFVLVIEGEEDYARHMQQEYNLTNPVISMLPENFQALKLPATPFSYIMDNEMKVQYKGITGTEMAFRMLIDKGSARIHPQSGKRRKAS